MSPRISTPHSLTGICIVTAGFFTVFTMGDPLIPLLVTSLTGSPGTLGFVISVSAVGSLFAAIPAGILVRRFGVKLPMLISTAVLALTSLSLAFIPSLWYLFVGLAVYELGKIVLIVAAQTEIAALSGSGDSSLNFGWYGAAAALGQMIGPTISGLLIDHIGYTAAWIGMSTGMFAVIGLIPPLVRDVYGRNPEPAGTEAEKKPEPGEKKNFMRFLDSGSLIAILASFIVLFAMGARTSFFPVYLNELSYSATFIGAMLSLRAIVSISVRLYMVWIIRKAGGQFQAMTGAMFLLAAGLATTPLCRDILTLSLNSVLIGIGIGLSLPLSMAVVSGGVKAEDRSIAMGIRLTGNRLAQIVNPVFFGSVSEWKGTGTAFVSGGIFLFLSTLPIYAWWRKHRASTPPFPEI